MSYMSSPAAKTTASVTVTVDTPREDVPSEVDNWLRSRGWTTPSNHPDTGEPLYEKNGDAYASPYLFRWHEAVAWESYIFLSIGGYP